MAAELVVQAIAAVATTGVVVFIGRRVLRRAAAIERVDPFTLTDPWRSYVQDAQSGQARFARIVDSVEPGPLRDRLGDIDERLRDGVSASWRIAQSGHALHKMVLAVSDRPSDSLTRMREREAAAAAKLATLVKQLDEAVARGAELATGQYAGLDAVADDVDVAVSDLEALRQALAEIQDA